MYDTIHSISYLLLTLCIVGNGLALCTRGSYLNLCGHCVGGGTDVNEVEGLDRCRVCDGQGDCVGCDGILNSPRRRDKCGMCLPPGAEQWNDCLKIDTVYPSVLDLSVESPLVPLIITGAGLKQFYSNTTQCLVLPLESQPDSPDVKDISLEENDIQIKVLLTESTGSYNIGCSEIEGFARLQVVDSRKLNVARINPSEVAIDRTTELQIEVEEDQSRNSKVPHWCFVRTRDGATDTFPATHVSGSHFRCSAYTPEVPGIVDVGIVAHEDAALNANGTGKTAELAIRGRRPIPETAEYGPDMQYIAVRFDQNVEIRSCSGAFSSRTEKSLGVGFSCTATGDVLYVTLGDGATVVESIDIAGDNTITRAGSTDTELSPNAEAAMVPVSKQKVMTPTFGLSLPNVVCADTTKQPVVNVMMSRLGKQKLKYGWTVPPVKEWKGRGQRENMMMWKHVRAVEAELNQATQADGFLLNRTMLLPGINYSIRVTSRNAFGDQSDVTASLKVTDTGNASVTLTTFPSSSAVVAEAKVTFCMDTPEPALRYKWTVDDNLVSEDGKLLIIPQTTPGTYNVSCTVVAHDSNQILGSGWALTRIVSVPGGVVVFPTETVVGTMDDIVLQAFSRDTRLRWSCATSAGEPCLVVGPNAVPVEDVVNVSSSRLRVPAGTLPVGRYVWTLYATEEAEATVTVSPRIPPDIRVTPPVPGTDSTRPLSLNADVERLREGCRIWWRTRRKKGYDYFDLQEDVGLGDVIHIAMDDLVTDEREAPLIIPAARGNWRGLTGGARFLLRLQTACPDPIPESHLDVTVVTNAPPRTSDLRVSPETGEALNTAFSIRTDEGSDSVEDYPLVYHLTWTDESNDEVSMGRSVFSRFDEPLPPGNLTVTIKTCDIRNSCSKSSRQISVQEPGTVTPETIRDWKQKIKNLMTSGDTTEAFGKAIVAFKTLSAKPELKESLNEVSSATESAVRDRLRDISGRLTSDPRLKLSLSFLEQSVTSLKHFPDSSGMVKLLTEFKNRILKPSVTRRRKREGENGAGKPETEEKLIRAIFELHSRNLESIGVDALPDAVTDVRRYMLELCSDGRRSFSIDFPGLALRTVRLSQGDAGKELPVAGDETAKVIISGRSVKPKTCLGTARYSRNLFDRERSTEMYEVRLIRRGNYESKEFTVTLPTSGELPGENCFAWSDSWNGTCSLTSKTEHTVTCRCDNSGYITLTHGSGPSLHVRTANDTEDANKTRTRASPEGAANLLPGSGGKPEGAGPKRGRYSRAADEDAKVNENTVKAIFDLHAKILEQNNTKANRDEFLKDVRKYMVETCTTIQDSVQDPVVIESSIITLKVKKLTQNDLKRELPVAGAPGAKLKFNFKTLPRKTCAALATYHGDFLNSTETERLSDMYEVQLIKNGTLKDNFKDDVKSMALTLPLYKNSSQEEVSCMTLSEGNEWKSSCTVKTKTDNATTCNCRDPGIFSVFALGKPTQTSAVPAVSGTNSTTTTAKSSLPAATTVAINTPAVSVTVTTTPTTTGATPNTTTTTTTTPTPTTITTTAVTTIGTTNSTPLIITKGTEGTAKTTTLQSVTATPTQNVTTTERSVLTSVIQNMRGVRDNNTGWYVSGTFKIEEDYDAVVGKNETAFVESLRRQMVEQLKIPVTAIAAILIRRGSIIVTVLFVDAENASAEAAVQDLVAKLHDGSLRLTGRNATILNVPRQDLKVKIGSSPTRNAGKVRLIAYGVVAGTLLAIFLIAFGAAYFKRKRTRMPLRLPHLSIDDHPTYRQFHNEFSLDGSSASLARYRRDHPFETETIQ